MEKQSYASNPRVSQAQSLGEDAVDNKSSSDQYQAKRLPRDVTHTFSTRSSSGLKHLFGSPVDRRRTSDYIVGTISTDNKLQATTTTPSLSVKRPCTFIQRREKIKRIPSNKTDGIALERSLTLIDGVSLLTGTVIGAGIFVSPQGITRNVGSVGASLIVWVVCGVLATIGALCFAELGTLINKSGGIYTYLREAFGDWAGFLYLYATTFLVYPIIMAVLASTCGRYIATAFFQCNMGGSELAVKAIGISVVFIVTITNVISSRFASSSTVFFTFIKISALCSIIITGLVNLSLGQHKNFVDSFQGTNTEASGIALGVYQGLFSFSGCNLPRAIMISLPLITIIYCMVNLAYFTSMTSAELVANSAPALLFAERNFKSWLYVMPLFVSCSTFGGANGLCTVSSRSTFAGARDGVLPELFALVSIRFLTPVTAILLEGLIAFAFLVSGETFVLITYSSFIESIMYLFSMLSLLKFRKIYKDKHRPVKVPLILPWIFIIISLFLVIVSCVSSWESTKVAILLLLSGIPVYFLGIVWKTKPEPVVDLSKNITHNAQKLIFGLSAQDNEEPQRLHKV